MTLTIVLPPINSKLHAHNKGHWSNKIKATSDLRQLACLKTKQLTDARWQAAAVLYRFYFPDLRRRDAANAIQATKPAIDGVVDAGLIPDDDWKHLEIAGVECFLDRKNPRVELCFRRKRIDES